MSPGGRIVKLGKWFDSLGCWGLIVLVAGGLLMPGSGRADALSDCMTEMMQEAGDDTTIGELRRQCRARLAREAPGAEDEAPAIVSERLRQDRENVLQPFSLMSHKPNYILLGAHNFSGYSPDLYRRQQDDASLDVNDTEVQFQISLKTPLAVGLFDLFDIYAAYTNHSFWQLYDSDSSPFRETNHEPEAWVQFQTDWHFLGVTNTANAIGFVHQSNGQGGVLSRSWNRVYAAMAFEMGPFAVGIKPWYRIPEDDADDDNPDITDYLGHYEVRAAYKWHDHVFSAMSRNNIESGFSKGAVELTWSFPLGDYPFLKGYVQYFNGYGESLIDYDQHVNKIGIGFALTDWL
jgi:phospholipase A1